MAARKKGGQTRTPKASSKSRSMPNKRPKSRPRQGVTESKRDLNLRGKTGLGRIANMLGAAATDNERDAQISFRTVVSQVGRSGTHADYMAASGKREYAKAKKRAANRRSSQTKGKRGARK